ncbi:MAG: hypothetical protein NT013_08695 [Planctomycetia bacterium]|nr:hypothetical protein [Planctomycetia bacterium]
MKPTATVGCRSATKTARSSSTWRRTADREEQTAEGGHPPLTGDHWLCLGPVLFFFGGHYRGSPGASDQIVYVAMLPDGSQRTYTPAEFAKQFGLKNDPEKAELLGKAEEPPEPKPAPAAPSTTSNTPTLPDTKSSAAIKKPMSKAVASLTPNKTVPITPPKTNSAELLADVERPQALNVPVSATKVDIPATLPKPKSGQPVSVRQIVTKPASLKDLASWSIEPAGHQEGIIAVAWSPNGEFVLSAGQDDALRLWRVEAGPKGPELRLHRLLIGERGGIQDAQFSPDGRTVAAVTFYGHQLALYDVATGRRLSALELKGATGRTL